MHGLGNPTREFSSRISPLNLLNLPKCPRLRTRLTREANSEEKDQTNRDFDNHLETGFQLATFQGPLCSEPMEGLVYFVENLEIDRAGIEAEQGKEHTEAIVSQAIDETHRTQQDGSGHRVIYICREGCLPERSARLVAAADVGYVRVRYSGIK